MKLDGILIGDKNFKACDFGGEDFLQAINSKLEEGNISPKISTGLGIITGYSPNKELNLDEQVEVARAIISLEATAITDGKVEITTESKLSSEETEILLLFNQSIESFNKEIISSLGTSELTEDDIILLHTLNGTTIGLYSLFDQGETTYHLCDTKIGGKTESMIVNHIGLEINSFEDNDEVYCLSENEEGVSIWYGSIKEGFEEVKKIKGHQLNKNMFYTNDTIGIDDGDIVILENLYTEKEIFCIDKKDLQGILFVSGGVKQTIVYLGHDDDGETRIFITDEEHLGQYIFNIEKGSKMHKYANGVVIIEFNKENDEYTLYDSNSGNIIEGIQCFKDLKGNIYYGGETCSIKQGNGELMFSFSKISDTGEIIEAIFDTTSKEKNTDIRGIPKPYIFDEVIGGYLH